MTVCYCKNDHLSVANVVNNAKRKSSKNVSVAVREIGRPSLGKFFDG